MKKLLLIQICLLLSGCLGATHAPKGKSLKYNHIEDEYKYAGEGENLRYNHIEDRYEFAGDGEELHYNYLEDEYTYE